MKPTPAQENKNLIQQYYAHFNTKNYSQMLEMMDDNIAHFINQSLDEVGKKKFEHFLKIMDDHYDENLSEITIMSNDEGTRLAAEFVCQGTYKKTSPGLPDAKNQKYRLPVGAFFEIKNGKIIRLSNHYNLNQWIQIVSK